jgi:hypothetical protein
MSKVAVSQYSVRMEAERRAKQKKMEEVRQMLSRCVSLRKTLEKMGEDGGAEFSETLARYKGAVRNGDWEAAAPDCDRLHSELPVLERQLEDKIIAAKERRLRLELSAATLRASAADQTEQKLLATIVRGATEASTSELGELGKQLESIMTKRLLAAAKGSNHRLTEAQLELARKLMNQSLPRGERAGITREHIDKTKQDGRLNDPRSRIEHFITQLASIEEHAGDLLDRARTLMMGGDTGQRNLQLDSLMFEAAERLKSCRKARELDTLSGGALAELAPFDGKERERLRSEVLAAREKQDSRLLEKLHREALAFARTEAARRDAIAARAAILLGLKELGYEIRMDGDIWDEGKRIQALRPDEPNYDIELSAAANGKIQSKVRAYDHPGRSAGVNLRDTEVEQSWCDDLRRLHQKLRTEGIEAAIEDERKPGSAAQRPLPARRGKRDRDAPDITRRQRNLG